MEQFDFSEALQRMRHGKQVWRLAWTGDTLNRWLVLRGSVELGLIVFIEDDGSESDWLEMPCDSLATDWVEVKECANGAV